MKHLRLLLFMLLAFQAAFIQAQDMITVTGKVTDSDSHDAISSASVTDAEGRHATVTNEDGTFILRMESSETAIKVSHIGYATRHITIEGNQPLNIRLRHTTIMLSDILAAKPEDVVAIAIKNIGANYVSQPVLQRCFYRETTRKGSRYIYVAEAITDMYRTPYVDGIAGDRVAIIKARRLISTSSKDTLGAKLIGGPTTPLTLDVVKNLEMLLNAPLLSYYDYAMTPTMSADGQGLVKVTITPKPDLRSAFPEALVYGDIYINTNTIAIVSVDLQLDLTDKAKATRAMLYKKPVGVRFKPRGMFLNLTYKPDATGKLTLSYIRSEVSFICEWKRKLFASPYHVVSEMVMTSEKTDSVKPIRSRSSFRQQESLYDHPEYFGDPNFWEQYNIIAPSESLEKGIGRLVKRTIKDSAHH